MEPTPDDLTAKAVAQAVSLGWHPGRPKRPRTTAKARVCDPFRSQTADLEDMATDN